MVIILSLLKSYHKGGVLFLLSYFAACGCSTIDVKNDTYMCDCGLGVLVNKKWSKFTYNALIDRLS